MLAQNVSARETTALSLEEKLGTSDLVFVGTVLSVTRPSTEVAGVGEYATVRIDRVLKGTESRDTVLFVTKGFSAEMNPLCCAEAKSYLFFAKRGFDVFDVTEAGASLVRKGQKSHLSSVNGPYSTYLVQGGHILGWKAQSGEDRAISVDQLAQLICSDGARASAADDPDK